MSENTQGRKPVGAYACSGIIYLSVLDHALWISVIQWIATKLRKNDVLSDITTYKEVNNVNTKEKKLIQIKRVMLKYKANITKKAGYLINFYYKPSNIYGLPKEL